MVYVFGLLVLASSSFVVAVTDRTTSCLSSTGACFASPSIPPPPPLSMPVWSLSSPLAKTSNENLPNASQGTTGSTDSDTSMNIVTFATAVSVAPPKIWAVSLYTNTLTRRAFLDSKVGVLQLLRPNQSKLVPILGKRSGYEENYSKREECKKIGYEWMSCGDDLDNNSSGLHVLPACASYIKLKLLNFHNAGDHDVALCRVVGTGTWDEDKRSVILNSGDGPPGEKALDPSTALYTAQLRAEGII